MISFTNLARALGMFTFEGRHTSNFTVCIIITVQYTLAESFTVLNETSIQVIIIRVVLKYVLITFTGYSDLHCKSKLGFRILGSHRCYRYDMDMLKNEITSISELSRQ